MNNSENISTLYSFSIIIPHFNSPDTLAELLDSIGEHEDVQVIVVDDRSTLPWKQVIEKYPSVEFYSNKGKKGPGTARNTGFLHASGKWVLFADSDDVMTENWYETISGFRNASEDIIFFPPDSINVDTSMHPTNRGKWYHGLCSKYLTTRDDKLLRSKFSSPCSKIIRRSLISEHDIKFDEIMHWEDSMFSAKTGYLAKSVGACASPIYQIHDHEGSMTTIHDKGANSTRLSVICEQYHFWQDKSGYDETLRILTNDAYGLLLKSSYGFFEIIGKVRYLRKNGIRITYKRMLKLLILRMKRMILCR